MRSDDGAILAIVAIVLIVGVPLLIRALWSGTKGVAKGIAKSVAKGAEEGRLEARRNAKPDDEE